MGSITSRGKDGWPPKPPKRDILRYQKKLVMENGEWVPKIVPVMDYTIDWPSLRCCSSSRAHADDTSAMQDAAIRAMEGE